MNVLSKVKTHLVIQVLIVFVLALIIITSLISANDALAEGKKDDAYGAILPSYRPSDNPLLKLSKDKMNWPPAIPPTPREVRGLEDPTAMEIYDLATGDVTRIASSDASQQPLVPGLTQVEPFSGLIPPGFVPESVLPPDDRVRVYTTESYPWRTICKLFITANDNSNWVCSGSIIGCPDGHGYHILTAGHCVYMHDHGGWVNSIEVVPGLDYDYMPYNYAWATFMRSYTGWTSSADHRHDWAMVTLDRNIGDYTGWMGRITTSDMSWYENGFNSAGYPTDLDCGVTNSSGLCMYFDFDYGRTANEYNHWYYMDTFGGQSGMPVWYYDDPNRYIATIHAYGNDGSGSNHGTRLNTDKFDRIITWCNSDTPPTDYADLIDDGQSYSGFSPTTVTPGQSFHAWCDVRNIGTASSGGFYVSFYASTNTNITTSDYLIGSDYVSSIFPFNWSDADWNGTFPCIPPGTYYVGWIIDRYGNVTEFNEGNNTAYKEAYQLTIPSYAMITVTSPDGAEEWGSGHIHNITWDRLCFYDNVKIQHSTNGGSTWSTITSNTANDGIYPWFVDSIFTLTCKVKVSDMVYGNPYDISDQNFTVYIPGDANHDENVSIADVVYLVNHVFKRMDPPVPLSAGDVDGDCKVVVQDIVYLVNFLFKRMAAPVEGCA